MGNLVKETSDSIRRFVYLKKASLRLWLAIKIADQKQLAYNRRFFVLPDADNRLLALSREDVMKLKRMGIMSKSVTHSSLMNEAFYYTPLSRNNTGGLTEMGKAKKKEKYFRWLLSLAK